MSQERSRATSEIQIDNDSVLVTRWDFLPGAETGWHRHEWDCVVVPLTDGNLMLETLTENYNVKLSRGTSYSRSAGTEHNAVNVGGSGFSFVEIEIKVSPISE